MLYLNVNLADIDAYDTYGEGEHGADEPDREHE
jgi:hypothetical protein